MDDIDFLASEKKDEGREKGGKKDARPDPMRMHVPQAEEKPADEKGGGLLSGVTDIFAKDEKDSRENAPIAERPEMPAKPIERVKPVVTPRSETPPPPPSPPKPPEPPKPPSPPPPPPKPPEPPKPERSEPSGGGTLRVSLLATEEGGGLTDLTVRGRVRTFLVVLIVGLLIDAVIFGGLLWYRASVANRIQAIEAGVEDLDREIAAAEARVRPAQNYQTVSRLALDLLDQHRRWEGLLALVEERTKPDVQFLNMSGVDSGTVLGNIVASDLTTIGRQLVAFREDPRVVGAEIGNVSADYGENGLIRGANTSLTIRFDPKVLTAGRTDSASATPVASAAGN